MKILHLDRAATKIIALLATTMAMSPVTANESLFPVTDLSPDQQTEMMQDYCVMCHLDRANNGGLSLEHFDAATVSPALAVMLVNKFTTPLEEVLRPDKDPALVEEIEAGKRMGAPSVMGVAGLPLAFVLDEQEAMANGDPGTSPPSSIVLAGTGMDDTDPSLTMPQSTLEISGPLPTESVEFSFAGLDASDHRLLSTCFAR